MTQLPGDTRDLIVRATRTRVRIRDRASADRRRPKADPSSQKGTSTGAGNAQETPLVPRVAPIGSVPRVLWQEGLNGVNRCRKRASI